MSREVKSFIIIELIFSFFLNVETFSSTSPYNIDSAALLILQQDYLSANQIVTEYLNSFPNDIKANYFLFAIEQTRLLDYESYSIEDKNIEVLCKKIKNKLEEKIKELKGFDSTLCLFYIANILGGMSVVQAKKGNWFEGLKNGLDAYFLFKKIKKKDPSFIAADLGIGIFNYYVATTLRIFPFIEVSEEEGINAVKRAIAAEPPFNFAAKNSLCWILIDKKDFKSADSIAQSVLDLYPNNTIFLRIKAHACLWGREYNKAFPLGKRMIELSEKRNPVNWSDLVAGYMILLSSEEKLGKKIELCKDAETFIKLKIPKEYTEIPHIKKNIKIIKEIYNDYCKDK